MPPLSEQRRSIQHLLNERDPADAMAAYYAFHHPDNRTNIITMPATTTRATAYLTLSRTGFDLFRPLVTLRLPQKTHIDLDLDTSHDFIYQALPPNTPFILYVPSQYMPFIRAVFDITSEHTLRLLQLPAYKFTPIVNILVIQTTGANDLVRYIIRQPPGDSQGEVVASASLNWQSPYFADLAVQTNPHYRQKGYGRSVVAALCRQLLDKRCTPLYLVENTNVASLELAKSIGFTDTHAQKSLLEVTLRPR